MTANELPTPFYIVYEDRLRANLRIINDVAERSGAKIIIAFKANALWRTFPIITEYCRNCTASSLARICNALCGHIFPAHAGPAPRSCSHITFFA